MGKETYRVFPERCLSIRRHTHCVRTKHCHVHRRTNLQWLRSNRLRPGLYVRLIFASQALRTVAEWI